MISRSSENKILQEKLHPYFSSNSMNRGYEYFSENSVKKFQVLDGSAFATVIGSEKYKVQLNWKKVEATKKITSLCTCPHFYEGNFCKHLWALILETDRQGIHRSEQSRSRWRARLGSVEQHAERWLHHRWQQSAASDPAAARGPGAVQN